MKFGTKEWASHNKNICIGCNHGCRYCYARYNAVCRFHRVKSEEEWINNMKLNSKALNESPKKYTDGRIMFPTQHDIFPDFIEETVEYLRRWLHVGNEILIVSKPHLECIQRICDDLEEYKNQIVFRFSIGSVHDDVLKFWEVNAPSFGERLGSLKYAFKHDYKTSVSAEPKLDVMVNLLVDRLSPFVNDSIWIGNLNFMEQRVDFSKWRAEDLRYKNMVVKAQEPVFIKWLYEKYKDNPKIRWKESIKKMLMLPDEEIG